MGARFRLSASFNLPASRCARACQVVIRAMKTYGLILADNGSNWYFQGTEDRRWTYTMVDQLKQIPASAFVGRRRVVPDGQPQLRPGTPARNRGLPRRLRLGASCSHAEQQPDDALGDDGGLLAALDLDREAVDESPTSRRPYR